MEDGIRDGWCSTEFLDFVRAAGDSLERIRFLVLTAYPLHRLGNHWVDRLVSATRRTLSYLDETHARDLIVAPAPEFPDIYPDGGVDRILRETGRHPFLIQKVCDELCRLLSKRAQSKASDADLTEAFDAVLHARQLVREGYLEKEGDRVRLAVPLFGVWIVDTQGPA